MALTDRERQALEELLGPPALAHLATLSADGWPQSTPIWCEFRDGELVMSVVATHVKVRNIRRDRRVAVSMALAAGRGSVAIKGLARLSEENVREVTERLARRYHPPDQIEARMRTLMRTPRVLIYVQPVRVALPQQYYPQDVSR